MVCAACISAMCQIQTDNNNSERRSASNLNVVKELFGLLAVTIKAKKKKTGSF